MKASRGVRFRSTVPAVGGAVNKFFFLKFFFRFVLVLFFWSLNNYIPILRFPNLRSAIASHRFPSLLFASLRFPSLPFASLRFPSLPFPSLPYLFPLPSPLTSRQPKTIISNSKYKNFTCSRLLLLYFSVEVPKQYLCSSTCLFWHFNVLRSLEVSNISAEHGSDHLA